VAAVIATAVNRDGRREILGLDIFTTEDGAGWTQFLRGLVARGLTGVALVISDDHLGLVQAVRATLPGAAWQRCRTLWGSKTPITLVTCRLRPSWPPVRSV
jgi:putative transposase